MENKEMNIFYHVINSGKHSGALLLHSTLLMTLLRFHPPRYLTRKYAQLLAVHVH